MVLVLHYHNNSLYNVQTLGIRLLLQLLSLHLELPANVYHVSLSIFGQIIVTGAARLITGINLPKDKEINPLSSSCSFHFQ